MDTEILELLAGKEFNEILAGDAVLKELEKSRYNSAGEKQLLLEVLQLGDYRIGKLPIRPLTVAKWSFLWLLESPFVIGGAVGLGDLDVFLYVLSLMDLRELNCSLEKIAKRADGYALAADLEAGELIDEVKNVIKSAFLPFDMMPLKTSGDSGESGIYDGIWASFMASTAARESGMSFDYCLHRMSLSTVCSLIVNWNRRERVDGGQIRRRIPQEIEEKITARIDALAKGYIEKKSLE